MLHKQDSSHITRNPLLHASLEYHFAERHCLSLYVLLPLRLSSKNSVPVFPSASPSTARSRDSMNICLQRINRALAGPIPPPVHNVEFYSGILVLMRITTHFSRGFAWLFMQTCSIGAQLWYTFDRQTEIGEGSGWRLNW